MDGTAVAAELLAAVERYAAAFERRSGRRACLATVLVGDDPASHTYVRMKVNRCRKVGIESRRVDLPAASTTEAVVALVRELSVDAGVDGILVQHPMPSHIDERQVFDAIAAAKDVDGVTTASFGAMSFGDKGFASCTPAGIMRLLDAYDVELTGRTVVVAAVGRAELIRGEWIKPGAVVIDAGYYEGNVGDVEFAGGRPGPTDHPGSWRRRSDDHRRAVRPDGRGRHR